MVVLVGGEEMWCRLSERVEKSWLFFGSILQGHLLELACVGVWVRDGGLLEGGEEGKNCVKFCIRLFWIDGAGSFPNWGSVW